MNNNQFDQYLISSDCAALTIREALVPAEGRDAVLFPPTYAPKKKGEEGGYNIDYFNDGKSSVCLIDSVGSQNNRIEPIFKYAPYAELVPQLVVQAGSKEINLLDAGHRAGDAIIRCSSISEEVSKSFKDILAGDCQSLAKLAPTSLVFGTWDSRGTQAKVPRVVSSVIRAYDIREIRRSAQYVPPVKYVAEELIPDHKGKNAEREMYAKKGYVDQPATFSHGGVIAEGGVRRDAILALAALRLLKVGSDTDATLKLQRYILGLALVAFTAPTEAYLRQGCLLVGDTKSPMEFNEVKRTGERVPATITHEKALEFTQTAATDFGVGESKTVSFDKKKAEADLKKKDAQQQD